MRQVYKINKNGYYIEPVILKKDKYIPDDCIEEKPPNGLYRAKWTGAEWIEDMTEEEIDAIKNRPRELSEIDIMRNYQLDLDFRISLIEMGVNINDL